MLKADVILNAAGKSKFYTSAGCDAKTTILFESQGFAVEIHNDGCVKIYNVEGRLIAEEKIPHPETGIEDYKTINRSKRDEIHCYIDENFITLDFPIYRYEDNYPNCDGEYDRWTTIIIGYYKLKYDYISQKTVLTKKLNGD